MGGGAAMVQDLAAIDALCLKQRQEGKLLKMLKTMEQSLLLRKDTLGTANPEVQSLGAKLTHEYNGIAMQILRADDMYDAVHSLLKKAYVMTDPDTFFVDAEQRLRLRAITLNNLGCLYKQRGKL